MHIYYNTHVMLAHLSYPVCVGGGRGGCTLHRWQHCGRQGDTRRYVCSRILDTCEAHKQISPLGSLNFQHVIHGHKEGQG